jgi:hypothetical protein
LKNRWGKEGEREYSAELQRGFLGPILRPSYRESSTVFEDAEKDE